MATIKKGQLTASGEWARHLRHGDDRIFWKRERAAEREAIREEIRSATADGELGVRPA